MIPKILHQIWIGPERPPERAMATWRNKHPDWRYMLHHKVDGYPSEVQSIIDSIDPVNGSKWAGIADVIRYFVLWRYGGVAVDADSECLRPLDERFLEPVEWCCHEHEEKHPGVLANGAMGARPGSLLMSRILQRLPAQDPREVPWHAWGPTRLSEEARTYRELTKFPSRYFMPWHYSGIPAPGFDEVFARQFWGSTRSTYGRGLDVSEQGMVVISTGVHVEQWAPACLGSVFDQTIAVRHIVVCDDATHAFVTTTARTNERGCLVLQTTDSGCAARNLYEAVHALPPHTIVVWLDLDDRLAIPWALEHIRDVYASTPGLELTYGTARGWPSETWVWPPRAYAPEVIERGTYRQAEWLGNHLRTFRAGLFQQIPWERFEGGDGSNIDQLVMLPLLELAAGNIRHVEQVVSLYNERNREAMPKDVARAEIAESDRIRAVAPIRRPRLAKTQRPIVVVSTGVDIPEFAALCVESVRTQTIRAAHHIVAADLSTLRASVAREDPSDQWFHDCLGHPLQNLDAIVRSLDPETIVVWLDLDDHLACSNALEIVGHVYETTGCVMTTGSWRFWPSMKPGWARPFPPEVVRHGSYRKSLWPDMPTHLRTFLAGHYHQLGDADLKRDDGSWWDTRDIAVLLPLLELGPHAYIPEILVDYNERNIPPPREWRAIELCDERGIRAMPRRSP